MEIISIVTLLASLIAAGASVYQAYQTRFGRFTSEKWWERKVDAYERIIEALYHLVSYYDQTYGVALHIIDDSSDDKKQEINEYWRKGYFEVKKASTVGAFLISIEAEKALQRFWAEQDKENEEGNWFEDIDRNLLEAKVCLKTLVDCAKKDLRVR